MSIEKLMKGLPWNKAKHRMAWPAAIEPKYDEIRLDIRLTADGVDFRSYADKPLHNLDKYAPHWRAFMREHGLTRIDCGVMVNQSFNDTYRFVRSSKGVPKDLDVRRVEFIVFDLPDMAHGLPWSERKARMVQMCNHRTLGNAPIWTPPYYHVANEEDVMGHYGMFVGQGLEGAMVKSFDHQYQPGKRIAGWLKVKPEEEADGVITAVIRGHSIDGEPLDRAGSVSVRFEDGSTCDAGGIPHELGRAMLADPDAFVGEWCVVKFMMRDRQGGYRHPSLLRLREAKE